MRVAQSFSVPRDEVVMGLGQQQNGMLNQKGVNVEIDQFNTQISIPWYVSSAGYGILWNSPSRGRIESSMGDLPQEAPLPYPSSHVKFVAQVATQIDYFVTTYPTVTTATATTVAPGTTSRLASMLRRLAEATGKPPRFNPDLTLFWQCKLRYETQEQVLNVSREYVRRNLSQYLSMIVIDYHHWLHNGDWSFDPTSWPDPLNMTNELRSHGVQTMVSVWPSVEKKSVNFRALHEGGLLARTESGVLKVSNQGALDGCDAYEYDAFSVEARSFVSSQIQQNYVKNGVNSFWLDADEGIAMGEVMELHRAAIVQPRADVVYSEDGYSGLQVGVAFPREHSRTFANLTRASASTGASAGVLLSRSAWTGSQALGVVVWSGDTRSDFAWLKLQIPAGLNMAMSGQLWWTSDAGGFNGGNNDDPDFRELLVRWLQFATLCPIMRIHGNRNCNSTESAGQGRCPNEPWSFGPQPYIVPLFDASTNFGDPIMRPLLYDFDDDANRLTLINPTRDFSDEYMFGPQLLVAPVTDLGARTRAVFLPALPKGKKWRNWWDDMELNGNQTIMADAPLDKIPLFYRGIKP